jgi:pantothenate synthetase
MVDAEDLQPVARIERPVLVAVAVLFAGRVPGSRVRLIDNVVLQP